MDLLNIKYQSPDYYLLTVRHNCYKDPIKCFGLNRILLKTDIQYNRVMIASPIIPLMCPSGIPVRIINPEQITNKIKYTSS